MNTPDLLAALQRLLRAFEADYEIAPGMDVATSFETNSQAIMHARNAIAKALDATPLIPTPSGDYTEFLNLSPKAQGARSEWRAARSLQEYSWHIYVSPGSLGVADFIAIRGSNVLAVQVKTGRTEMTKSETSELVAFASAFNAHACFAYWGERKMIWKVWNQTTWIQTTAKLLSRFSPFIPPTP
jgi:Holliday junction resolvase